MLKEFKDFLLRGNIVELAVAFVMGVAFGALVNSFVNNLVMPIVAMIIGKPDFSNLTFTINDAVFRYGAFITDAITFIATAAAVFFFVVKPMNAIMARMRKPGEEEITDEERRHQELLAALRARASGGRPRASARGAGARYGSSASSPTVSPGGSERTASSARSTPGTNASREVVSCRIVSVSPGPPRITSWWATRPGSRTEWIGTEPPIRAAVAFAVPDGASSFVSAWSSTISARGNARAASSANRIIRTAPTAKFGA